MVRSCAWATAVAILAVYLIGASERSDSPPTFSLDRRVPLTTSRVKGWPDPPPPYRTRRVFEQHAFRSPVYLTSHPVHHRLFVVELAGRVVHFAPDGSGKLETFVEVPDSDAYSMTFHPRYKDNRLVYLFTNGPRPAGDKRRNQILRYKTVGDPPRCDPASRQLVIEWESNGHNGGDLAFGPDGLLYISSGDGTSDSDTNLTGQDLRDLCSAILRIDVDRVPPGRTYAIPPDNPFLKTPNARPEIWSFGLRNPWRMTFDPTSGELLVADVGQDLWEMIHICRRGSNHGWSVQEGSRPFQPLRARGPGEIVPPLIEHPHSESRSITGGLVYQGKKFPALRGVYVYADYSTGKVWGLRHKAGKVTWRGDLAQTRLQTVGIGADHEGELYLVDHAGQIHTLEESPAAPVTQSFPRKLSDSGLFLSVKGHVLHPALIPYSVNSPLWSDGAHKERAIGLPGLESIAYRPENAWDCPDQTVLVKTFSLDLADGTRKRIETRFLTRQMGEWYGYSYAWNDQESDGELVGAEGMNRTYQIRDSSAPGGVRDLVWRYPSRVECMVCHTRAAGFVLGLSTEQMNRVHDYHGTPMNQLVALEKLGALKLQPLQQVDALEQRLSQLGTSLQLLMPSPARQALQRTAMEPLQPFVQKLRQQVRNGVQKRPHTGFLPHVSELLPRLVDPQDESAPLEQRVRAYLHSNCSSCHVWAGGGNSAINLHYSTPRADMKLIDVPPLHDRFGIADARLVAPGAPERSILFQRISRRGKGQMPPLASQRVDDHAVWLIERWIKEMR